MTGWASLHDATIEASYPFPEELLDFDDYAYSPGRSLHSLTAKVFYLTGLEPIADDDLEATSSKKAVAQALEKTVSTQFPLEWALLGRVNYLPEIIQSFECGTWDIDMTGWKAWPHTEPESVAKAAIDLMTVKISSIRKAWKYCIWSLALMGLLHQYLKTDRCKFCYRRTWLGQILCRLHSQAFASGETQSLAYMRYRAGKKGYEMALDQGILNRIKGITKPTEVISKISLKNLLYQFEYDSELIAQEIVSIGFMLGFCKNVTSLIHDPDLLDRPYREIVATLRRHLDPDNRDEFNWARIIVLAERWMAIEAKVSPGKNGPRWRTVDRKQRALDYLKQGYKKRDVAKLLGVSPAAVSKWNLVAKT